MAWLRTQADFLKDFETSALVDELKRRKDKVSFLQVEKGEPLDISIDAEEIELQWCEGPLAVLVVAN
jgi:hypothetical protein